MSIMEVNQKTCDITRLIKKNNSSTFIPRPISRRTLLHCFALRGHDFDSQFLSKKMLPQVLKMFFRLRKSCKKTVCLSSFNISKIVFFRTFAHYPLQHTTSSELAQCQSCVERRRALEEFKLPAFFSLFLSSHFPFFLSSTLCSLTSCSSSWTR